MIVLIRSDASSEIGIGHVMRCAALGMRLMAGGAQIHFACAELPSSLVDWLHKCGFKLTVLPAADVSDWRVDLTATCDAVRSIGHIDLLIVDHYGLNQAWERGLRPYVGRILVIDDLADRDHDCDMLLDQNLHESPQTRYEKRVPQGAQLFLGPRYAMLRNEFDKMDLERSRDGRLKQLLVFLGGDPNNQVLRIIDALRGLGLHAPESTIVLGAAHPHRSVVHKNVADLSKVHVLDTTDQMARLIAHADLVIGTCGVSAWERCLLGVPSLVVVTAENQREDAEILHRLGAVENLGDADDVSAEGWEVALRNAMSDPNHLRAMATASRKVMAGREAALVEMEKALIDAVT